MPHRNWFHAFHGFLNAVAAGYQRIFNVLAVSLAPLWRRAFPPRLALPPVPMFRAVVFDAAKVASFRDRLIRRNPAARHGPWMSPSIALAA